jgi:hypothetical protein
MHCAGLAKRTATIPICTDSLGRMLTLEILPCIQLVEPGSGGDQGRSKVVSGIGKVRAEDGGEDEDKLGMHDVRVGVRGG